MLDIVSTLFPPFYNNISPLIYGSELRNVCLSQNFIFISFIEDSKFKKSKSIVICLEPGQDIMVDFVKILFPPFYNNLSPLTYNSELRNVCQSQNFIFISFVEDSKFKKSKFYVYFIHRGFISQTSQIVRAEKYFVL